MKLYIYIRDHEQYLKGDFNHCFQTVEDKEFYERVFPEWTFFTEIDVDAEVDNAKVTESALTIIDEQISKTRAELQSRVDSLETRKANLLAITHQS